MSEKARELLSNMKSTAASRFNAAKRLDERERSLTRLTAFASAYLIGLTILPYFIHLPVGSADRLNLLSVALGVIILVVSLMQYSARDGVSAEQHYRCGLAIGKMRRRLKISADEISDLELAEVADEYALILQTYGINHDQEDYDQFRIERDDEFKKMTRLEKTIIPIKIILSRYLPTFILVTITILILCLVMAIIGPAWQLAAPASQG